jgi:hypothetical protein
MVIFYFKAVFICKTLKNVSLSGITLPPSTDWGARDPEVLSALAGVFNGTSGCLLSTSGAKVAAQSI